ncbi:hypothetical protein Tco_0952342 [Tanacetum coccineum]|uniref:Uncharacterized protein n=1 Tax=Tanacetum coccineum TaxID=301880 RepID=A0ABQ5DXG9_9ASTR
MEGEDVKKRIGEVGRSRVIRRGAFKYNKYKEGSFEDEDKDEIKGLIWVNNCIANKKEKIRQLVPSCYVIFDLEPLSLSFDFVHAHTMHHLESLLTISLDNLCLDNLDIFKEDLEYQSLRKSSNIDVLDSPRLLVLNTETSQSRQHVITSLIHIESRKSPIAELFDVDSRRTSIVIVNTKEYHSDILEKSQGYCIGLFVITCVLDVKQ